MGNYAILRSPAAHEKVSAACSSPICSIFERAGAKHYFLATDDDRDISVSTNIRVLPVKIRPSIKATDKTSALPISMREISRMSSW